jgi:hypothetical protein
MSDDDSHPDSMKWPFPLTDFGKIRLGKGVVGKTSRIVAFATIGLVVICLAFIWVGFPWLAASGVLLMLGMIGAYCYKAFDYAEKNPGPALLEGADLITFSAMQMGAKDPKIIENSPSGNENVDSVPQIEGGE